MERNDEAPYIILAYTHFKSRPGNQILVKIDKIADAPAKAGVR